MTMLRNKQDRRGFTLTELAIVLGIMGTILGAIWTASSRVSASNKVQKAQGQVQLILSSYRSLFAQHAVDTGAGQVEITTTGINAGFFPSEMVSGGVVTSPWGGIVKVFGVQAMNTIIISYYDIPQSACVGLAASEANAPDLVLSFVGLSGTSPHPLAYPASAPMSTTTINTYCADSATNDEVSFGFKAQ